MKSKRVRHGQVALAVCGALLSAGTIAAAAGPRPLSVADTARLSALTLPEPISTEGNLPKVLHPSLAGLTGRHEVLIRLGGQSVAGSDESRSREAVVAEQAAAVDRILAVAPSADVRASLQLALNAVVMRMMVPIRVSLSQPVAGGDECEHQDEADHSDYIHCDQHVSSSFAEARFG